MSIKMTPYKKDKRDFNTIKHNRKALKQENVNNVVMHRQGISFPDLGKKKLQPFVTDHSILPGRFYESERKTGKKAVDSLPSSISAQNLFNNISIDSNERE